jgi:Protein of unknown function (DUF4232)
MRPARIIAAVAVAAAIAVTGCSAHSTATNPAAAPQPQETAAPPSPAPTTRPAAVPPSTSGSRETAGPGRCAASALQGSLQGSEGAAGTIWTTVRLRNASGRTCTVRGIPAVRLLGAQGRPVTAPSVPSGPAGSLVVLHPGQASRFTFSEPNACDTSAMGSRLLVTMPQGRGSLVVDLDGETRFGTCAKVAVQALQPSPAPATPSLDRISDPQVAADRLVAAWVDGDRAAARRLVSQSVTDRLFSASSPAKRPAALPCRLADLGVYLCSYSLGAPNELSVWVEGGASAGYRVSGVEFVD